MARGGFFVAVILTAVLLAATVKTVETFEGLSVSSPGLGFQQTTSTATSGATWVAAKVRKSPNVWSRGRWTLHRLARYYAGKKPSDDVEADCPYWAVITSIFGPTKLAVQLSRSVNWCTVIVGDRKSPSKATWIDDFVQLGGNSSSVHFLSPADQDSLPFTTARTVPWNHFGRKNAGYLYALAHGAQVIYDTDDDNELHGPSVSIDATDPGVYLTRAAKALENGSLSCLESQGPAVDVFNPYPGFRIGGAKASKALPAWPRGFPLDRIWDETTHNASTSVSDCKSVSILQSLADNDPDVDAIYRMTRPLPLDFEPTPRFLVLPQGTMAPFNAQATLYHRNAFWGLLLPVTVHGRVSDILRSYFVQRLMWDTGRTLAFSSPLVRQVRNAHSYLADFVAEQPLYTRSGELVRCLREWIAPTGSFPSRFLALMVNMFELGIVEELDVRLAHAWIGDFEALGYRWP